MATSSSSSSSAKVLLLTCLLMHISMELSSASAIPIWEYLMRDEKMLYLYSTFAQLVSVHCKATAATTNEPVNQCKRNLLSYGYGQLQTFSDNELDALDVSQRGANELIWSSIMKHHPSSTLITTRKPLPTPPATSIIILTHQKPNKGSGVSSTPIYEGEASEISGLLSGNTENTYPKNPLFGDDDSEEEQKHQYAMDMDIAYGYPGQERPSQVETFQVPIQKQQVHPSLLPKAQSEKTFLTGPLVFRLRPDGSPVEEDFNKPLPKDDDLEAFPIFSYNPSKTSKASNSEDTTQPQNPHNKHRKIATISALKQQHFASLGINQELQPPSLPSDAPRAQRRFQVEAYPSAGTYHFYPRRQ